MRLLIIQVAGLGHDLVTTYADIFNRLPGGSFKPITPAFPAVTCTAQASFRTGLPAEKHGMISNGLFLREAAKVEFWNQSAHLISGKRLWERAQKQGAKVGMMFWQQSLGENISMLLSPAPIHKHGGGMIQDCYSRPTTLYPELSESIGKGFNLMNYWGPLASQKSSAWIAQATDAVLKDAKWHPDILMTYIPHLDYCLQKHGPNTTDTLRREVEITVDILARLMQTAEFEGYHTLIWGDYAITQADRTIFPNRILESAGFFHDREVRGHTYPDLYASPALAVVDHQIAHVYIRNPDLIPEIKPLFEASDGIEQVRDKPTDAHPNFGELCLVAEENAWFAYPWWEPGKVKPPDYATHVDIHNKIGFDPCELFWGRLIPPGTSLDPTRVKGTHGRTQPSAAYMTTLQELPSDPTTTEALAQLFLDQLANREN